MKIIEEIQDNAITKLRFTGYDDDVIDNIHEVIGAIKKNSSILTIDFVQDFLGCVRHDARTELFQAICRIPCLQEVHLDEGLIQIVDIAELLCEVQGLKVLTLKGIVLQGVEEDFNATEMSLHQHRSLKEFTMDNCRPAVEGMSMETLELAGKKQSGAPVGSIRTSSPNPANARTA